MSPSTPGGKRFGTFAGVYIPSVLTMASVVLYLRAGWVVGQLGLPLAIAIVLVAGGVAFITALSLSAVATNRSVGPGGEYHLLSRSLGLESGGAIGLPLVFCRAGSLAFCAFGLAESLGFLWPSSWGGPPLRLLAGGIVIVIAAFASSGATFGARLQLPLLALVSLSVLALLGGALAGGLHLPEVGRAASGDPGFWEVFAVFFPALTGFSVGIGRSGDLEDSKRSIPKGTMTALLTGIGIYLVVLVCFGVSSRVDASDLRWLDANEPPVWTRVAWGGSSLALPAMWVAILASAGGTMMVGPRMLQALAADGLAPSLLARSGPRGQPVVATWATAALGVATVGLGSLNTIGLCVTILFLTAYVGINLAAGLERLAGLGSYRPTLTVPGTVSLLGGVAAMTILFLTSWWAALLALGLELTLYLHLRHRAIKSAWGDARTGVWATLARFSLLQLRRQEAHARNWRPHIVLFTRNPESRMGLVRLANWFNQNRGVVTVCELVQGQLGAERFNIEARRRAMQSRFAGEGVEAFPEVMVVSQLEEGILAVVQANGFAGLSSNTLMFGWPGHDQGVVLLLRTLLAVSPIDKSFIIARLPTAEEPVEGRQIDVWWRGQGHNGDLMLLLAHLLRLNPEWRASHITARTIVESGDDVEPVQERLLLLATLAPGAGTEVIIRPAASSVRDVMREVSRAADMVFLGLAMPDPAEDLEGAASRLREAAGDFQATVFVRNNGPFRGAAALASHAGR